MGLNLEQKKAVVAEVSAQVAQSQAIVLAEYRGMEVGDMTKLRAKARESGVYFRVLRNTLARRAVAETPFAGLADKMSGPLAYGMSSDPVAVAKVMHEYAKANDKFVIPPGAPNHRVDGAITLRRDGELVSLMPHMHLRGKAMEISAVYPGGEREMLLRVPRYDFNWQLWYQLPPGKRLPAGTRIEASGYFDNSPNNKSNPDPAAAVRYGDQSWEEMMFGFFDVAIDAAMNPAELLREPARSAARPAALGSGGQ